jgi:PAS domain S-box-containing protein
MTDALLSQPASRPAATQTARELVRLARGCAAISVLVGVIVLIGWALDIPVLKSVLPIWVTMKANTAACFVLAGVALWLKTRAPDPPANAPTPGRWDRVRGHAANLCAGTVLLAGALTLVEYAIGIDLGIDQLLFREHAGAVYTSHLGRMAPNTAMSFGLIGLALLLLDLRTRGGWYPAQVLTLLQGTVALFALIGYLYGASVFLGFSTFTKMAAHTAVTFLAISFGLLLARPNHGIAAVAAGEDAAGVLLRRLLPLLIVIFTVLGWLRLFGEQQGLYPPEVGTAFRITLTIVITIAIVYRMARTLRDQELRRRQAEEALRRLNAELEHKVSDRTAQLDAAFEALRGERDFASAVLHTIGALVVVLDREGRIVRFNRACEQTTGYEFLDVRRRLFWDIFLVPEERQSVSTVFHRLRAGDFPQTHENFWLTRDGARRLIAWSNTCITDADGIVEYIIGTGIDITERHAAEDALRRAHSELEARVQQRTAELAAANRELEAFSYSVSHDLRQPLCSIDGFSHALLDDCRHLLNDQAMEYLQRVRRAAGRMSDLIDALLKLSRVTRSDIRCEAVNLADLARTIAASLRLQAPERKVEWIIPPRIDARGDPALLQIALENLLGNAWKFTGNHPHPRIEFGALSGAQFASAFPELPETAALAAPDAPPVAVPPDATVYFVRDNGAGFDSAYAAKLFGAFQRLHSADEFPGTGIGLATVQRIVHRHGGRVWAYGKPGAGATFCFELGAATHEKGA